MKKKIRIILKKNVNNLGEKYDKLYVKPGYARNYLIPKGLALFALPKNVKNINEILKQRNKKEKIYIEKAKKIEKKLKKVKIKITRKIGKNGILFGSISNNDIYIFLKEIGINVEKKLIKISGKNIKHPGRYKAYIKTYKNNEIPIIFEVKAIS